jgi:phosphoribosyl 1,2-cyclic phosphate phosphodiesterase
VLALAGFDLSIVDALRYKPHSSHFSVDDTLAWIERIEPKRAILTNMHADIDYAEIAAKLPSHVVPAYDGLSVVVGEEFQALRPNR